MVSHHGNSFIYLSTQISNNISNTTLKIKFYIKDFSSKCDQIRSRQHLKNLKG